MRYLLISKTCHQQSSVRPHPSAHLLLGQEIQKGDAISGIVEPQEQAQNSTDAVQ